MSFLTPLSPPEAKSPIEQLFDRDPLTLQEDEILTITAELVRLCRVNIEQFNAEQTKVARTGTRTSGTRVKKAQLTAQQQALVKELATSLDPFA